MAQGRFLSSSVAEDERLNSLSVEAQMMYLMTIPHLDRDGLINGNPSVLRGRVCPLREDFAPKMGKIIEEWVRSGLVLRYAAGDGTALWFKGFSKNNPLTHYHREKASKYPPPPGYTHGDKGIIPLPKPDSSDDVPPSNNDGGDDLPDTSGNHPDTSGIYPPEVEVEDQVEVEECAPPAAAAANSKPKYRRPPVSEFVAEYERVWGLQVSSEYVGDQIKEWERRVTLEGWRYALQECADNRNIGKWKYLKTILERIEREGYQPKEPAKATTTTSTLDFAFEDLRP
jgi:hypothetical protein